MGPGPAHWQGPRAGNRRPGAWGYHGRGRPGPRPTLSHESEAQPPLGPRRDPARRRRLVMMMRPPSHESGANRRDPLACLVDRNLNLSNLCYHHCVTSHEVQVQLELFDTDSEAAVELQDGRHRDLTRKYHGPVSSKMCIKCRRCHCRNASGRDSVTVTATVTALAVSESSACVP